MPDPLALAHRADLQTLTKLADNDLSLIWADLQNADAVVVRDTLVEVLPQLVDMYGSAASSLGADWYDEMRDAAAAEGRFRAIAAELPDVGRTDALARWGVTPLFGEEPDVQTARSKVSGGLQRIVADADRQTVIGSLRSDPHAAGWQRITNGGCPFCVMLAGRGAVYSAQTADFRSHDHCHCIAVPVFDGDSRQVLNETPTEVVDHVADPTPPEQAAPAGGFLSRDRYEAMRPEAHWSEEKRTAILNALRQDDEGKVLADTLDKFQDGGSISRLRTNIDKRLRGEALDKTSEARVDTLLDAIRNAPDDWAPDTLYRGMTVKGKLDNVLAKYEVGGDIDLSLTSFSSDRKVATRFQQMTAKGGTGETRVMVELVGPDKKVLPVQNLARDRRLHREKEWVGAGNFRVVSVKKSSGAILLRIEQVGTL